MKGMVLDRAPAMQTREGMAPVDLERAAVMSEKPQCRAPTILADLDDFGAHGRVGCALPDLAFLKTHRLLLSGDSTIAWRPARRHQRFNVAGAPITADHAAMRLIPNYA